MGRVRHYSNTGLLSYGWQPRDSVIADTLTQADPDGGTSTLRPAGMTSATVVCACTAHAGGSASLRMILQGSNDDGANWHTISQTSDAEAIGAVGQVRTLGAEGSNSVDVGRWENIRVIADEIASGGNWTITTTLSGFAYPCASGQDATALASGATVTVNGAAFGRRAGTRYATVAVRTVSSTLAGQTVACVLQGSADGGTTWDTISDSMNISAPGSVVMTQNGSTLIDMGGFNTLRFRSTDTNVTAYVASAVLSSDGCDWMVAGDGGSGSELPANAVVNFQWDAPGTEAGNTIRIVGRMLDLNGAPIALARTFKFTLSDTSLTGDLDLSTNGSFSAVTAGTARTAVSGTQIVVTTTASGIVDLSVLDAAAETIFCAASVDGIPKQDLLILAQSEQVSLVFT